MSPDSENAPRLADLNDGKNCMSCRNSKGAPWKTMSSPPLLSGKCRGCILRATTDSMFPSWEPKTED
jgi:hypothetical protein